MRLYVGNLSYTTTEDTLRELFSNYGDVVSVTIMKDKFTEQSRGFAFVEMGTEIMGERGIGGMNGKSVDGRRIRVSEAVDKPKTDGGARNFLKRDDDRKNFRTRKDFSGRGPSRGRSDRENREERSERPERNFRERRERKPSAEAHAEEY